MEEISELKKEYILRERKRKRKKTIILFIPISFLIILFLIKISFSLFPSATCFDGRMNGEEQGIDCGGSCISCDIKYAKEIEILSSDILSGEKGFSQGVFKIRNSNQNLGGEFKYKILVKGELGEELEEIFGESYIYPAVIKYLVEPKIDIDISLIKNLEIEVFEIEWFESEFSPRDFFNVFEYQVKTIEEADRPGYLEVLGRIANRTARDFNSVDLIILLYSKTGQLLNSAKTRIFDLKSGEINNFQYVWLNYFPEITQIDLNRLDVYADALVK
jgi:hypothetical protein